MSRNGYSLWYMPKRIQSNQSQNETSLSVGIYIGPVCQSCNLQLKCRTWNNEFFVPCFFHNSSAYNLHLIIKYLHKKQSKITIIPSNTEQFIGFQIDGIRYLDSYKFLSSSLAISLKIYTTMGSIVSNTRLVMAIRTFSRRVYMHKSI